MHRLVKDDGGNSLLVILNYCLFLIKILVVLNYCLFLIKIRLN